MIGPITPAHVDWEIDGASDAEVAAAKENIAAALNYINEDLFLTPGDVPGTFTITAWFPATEIAQQYLVWKECSAWRLDFYKPITDSLGSVVDGPDGRTLDCTTNAECWADWLEYQASQIRLRLARYRAR